MRALIAIAFSGALLAAAVTVSTAGASSVACRWRVLLDAPGPELSAIAAVTDRDVWAVGDDGVRPAILRWDGRRWATARAPIFAFDIDAVSARDIWIVGSSTLGALNQRPRAAHWDGVRWRTVPVAGEPGSYLRAVAALSPDDVWAVGEKQRGPLIEHWNGRAWKPVTARPRDGLLHAIDALSPGAVWAVGTQGMTMPTGGSEDPLVERLQGGRWLLQPTPSVDSVDENLLDVDAVSPGDVWAVGSIDVLGGRAPLVLRLDGRTWRGESISGLPSARAALSAVAAFGSNDVWVAGYRGFGEGEHVLLAHWNGTRWAQVSAGFGHVADLAALSPHDIWAGGGFTGVTGRPRSLVERYSCR